MANDLYKRLAQHLDSLPGGFPPTESGVELRILRKLFSENEAELALHLTLIPEEPRVIARRSNISLLEAAQRLEAMALKGLIYRAERVPGTPTYMAAQYVIGIWEFHVNDLDPELIEDMDEYIPHLLNTAWKKPQLRTIPVGKSIDAELEVMTYERAEALIGHHDRFAIAPCICRREKQIMGEGCSRTKDACLVFGMAADFYIKNGLGRPARKQEILEALENANRHGLVLQPGNSQTVSNICCCCGCCCAVLRTLKTLPKPVDWVSSPFVVEVDSGTCTGCELCPDRCQLDALSMKNGMVFLDQNRCIGCGLCVSTCPTGAVRLVRKPLPDQPAVPKNSVLAAIEHGRARGKLGVAELVKLQVRSKVDRMLAPR